MLYNIQGRSYPQVIELIKTTNIIKEEKDMSNIRSYKKLIRELNVGDTFYYNSIAGTISMIEYTRQLIQEGKIRPVKAELDKMIKLEAQDDFFSGKSICPQMTYEILR